jgi:hypothetical protein
LFTFSESDNFFYSVGHCFVSVSCGLFANIVCQMLLRVEDSFESHRRSHLCQLVIAGFQGIVGVILVGRLIIQRESVGIVVTSSLYTLLHFLLNEHEYYKFRKFEAACRPLAALPNCSSADLMWQECCIICRQKMTPMLSKRLPCHHCMHLACLVRWMAVQPKCPLCQASLSRLRHADYPYFHTFEHALARYEAHPPWLRPGPTGFHLFHEMSDRFTELKAERRFLERLQEELDILKFPSKMEIAENQRFIRLCDRFIEKFRTVLKQYEAALWPGDENEHLQFPC